MNIELTFSKLQPQSFDSPASHVFMSVLQLPSAGDGADTTPAQRLGVARWIWLELLCMELMDPSTHWLRNMRRYMELSLMKEYSLGKCHCNFSAVRATRQEALH